MGSEPRVSAPSPPMLGPAQEMGLWGPHTGKQAIHHTGWLWGVGVGAVFPEEAGAGPLKSPIKQLIPQMQGWELGKGGSSYPLVWCCQGLGLLMGT